MTAPGLKRVLGPMDVALFCVTIVFSLRGMATAARMGPLAILLWVLAVTAFFVPLALTVTELGSRDPGEGGFYRWVRSAFGEHHGFLAAWVYWLSNLTYLPSLLFFLAANVVFVAGQGAVGEDPWFVTPFALGVLALATWLNVRGFQLGKLVTNAGALAVWLAALLLIAAGAVAFARYGSATPFRLGEMFSAARDPRTLGYFGTLSLALVGIELAGVMGGEIRDPARSIPRAIAVAGVSVAVLYILGTVAILVAVPPEQVNPISGVIGAVQAVADRAGWPFLPVVTAVLISLSAFAGFTAWLGGMARLPYAIGLARYLPDAMARLHPVHRTPATAIVTQAALTSVFIVAAQAGASVREAYLVLLDMTIVLNFAPLLYIFLALPRLRPVGAEPGVTRIPGGRGVVWVVAMAGLVTTALTLLSAATPPPDIGNVWIFHTKLWGGMVVFTVVGITLFRRFRSRAAA